LKIEAASLWINILHLSSLVQVTRITIAAVFAAAFAAWVADRPCGWIASSPAIELSQ
jgi:hypothetical protein